MNNYQRIAKAINYIKEHATNQPKLDEIARAIHLSPYHFHRLFKDWAGVTPKEFLQYISLNHAKELLEQNRTVEEATYHTGLSSNSRLHDMFITIEGMTPGEFKNGGQDLEILYNFIETGFGDTIVTSTERGICNLMFVQDKEQGFRQLNKIWYNAEIKQGRNQLITDTEDAFHNYWDIVENIKLHLKGSKFHIKVWEALLKLPVGLLSSYSDIAENIEKPKAFRAVGNAVAKNSVAFLIPCHRVIIKAGDIGEYRWGPIRKSAIIGWEAAQIQLKNK